MGSPVYTTMKKITTILALTIGLWAIDACCDCDAALPYFDYSVLFTETYINYGENKLRIAVYPGDVNYIVDASSVSSPGFCTAVRANSCRCNEPGYMGAKYPLDSISITADRDFAADVPAGTPLNAYFKVTTTRFPTSGNNVDAPLDPATVFSLNELSNIEYFQFATYDPLNLYLVKQPDTIPTEGFSFTITCYKSNGTTIEHTLPATRW